MLDHAGEALAVLVGFWRFILSRTYRQRKIEEWREARRSRGGRLAIAAEIVVSVVIGLGLPVAMSSLQRTVEPRAMKIDATERRLLKAVEAGEWARIARLATARVRYVRFATATLSRLRRA